MKNQDGWTPSKFVYRSGKLMGSRDPKEVGIGSRFVTDLAAARYDVLLKEFASGRLIDLGCGKVPLYATYKDHVTEITCVDWENSLHKNEYLDYTCDLTQPLPLESGAYDTVVLSSVLEHIPEPERLWAELERILSPGGKLIMNVPFFYWIHEAPHDFYRYTEFALRRFAERAGMEVIQLNASGGAAEIVTDILAKNLVRFPVLGPTLSKILQAVMKVLVATPPGRKLSEKSGKRFPLGYFLVAVKT